MSDTFKGVGHMKGGAFLAPYSQMKDQTEWPMEYHIERAVDAIEELNDAEEIDDISNLAERAAFFVSGSNDVSVPPHNQEAARLTLEHFGMTMTDSITRADGHGWHKDNAWLTIEHLYTSLGYVEAIETSEWWFDAETVGSFYPWSQHEFYPEDHDWELTNFKNRDNGYIYVPAQCETQQCKLHFVLHGWGGSPNKGNQAFFN